MFSRCFFDTPSAPTRDGFSWARVGALYYVRRVFHGAQSHLRRFLTAGILHKFLPVIFDQHGQGHFVDRVNSDIFFVFWPGPILQVFPARSPFGEDLFERLFILLEHMGPKEVHQRAPVGGGILLVQGRNDAS